MQGDDIIGFGKAIPADIREWRRILQNINQFVRSVGEDFILSDNTVLPDNNSQIDSLRAFLPPPPELSASTEARIDAIRAFMPKTNSEVSIESKMDAIRSFMPPQQIQQFAADIQPILANQIFGAR